MTRFVFGMWRQEVSSPRLEGIQKRVTSVAYAPAGGTLASGGYDNNEVRFWDIASYVGWRADGRGRDFLGTDQKRIFADRAGD